MSPRCHLILCYAGRPLSCAGKTFQTVIADSSYGRYLDSEQRIVASKVIKRWIMNSKKTAFVVEHDFLMSTYLADRVIVFDGQPGIKAHANKAESLLTGCNKFLKALDVTFRVRCIPFTLYHYTFLLSAENANDKKCSGANLEIRSVILRTSVPGSTRWTLNWTRSRS